MRALLLALPQLLLVIDEHIQKKSEEPMTHEKDPYLQAGVDATRGDELVDWLQSKSQPFSSPFGLGRVIDGIGGFAGLFSIRLNKFKNPALVASTDGVGTKLLLALESNKLECLGQDLVAMCVNDLYTLGALPLFFLDYYATGHLDSDQFKKILTAIKASCQTCQMALLGGETAEMPGLYAQKHFDLAGFVVGVVDEEHRLGPHKTKPGDVLVAFKSSGFHSNGFSLIRKWLSQKPRPDLLHKLLAPTKLYNAVTEMFVRHPSSFHALANITGGGISGNLPRVIGPETCATIPFKNLPIPVWMREFINSNDVSERDVEHVFNLGVGMIAIVDGRAIDSFVKDAQEMGLEPSVIGELSKSKGPASVLFV